MKGMFKLFTSALLALAALAFGSGAWAADTIKGINQNGAQETVGTKPIFAVQFSGGVLSYRSAIGSGTSYALADANGSQYSKALASFGSGNAVAAPGGWFYDLGKIKALCSGTTSVVSIQGVNNADYIADNCALANAANSQ